MDYIDENRGDTLVVKDYYDLGNQPNSLYYALTLDNDSVPEGRVYLLKENGYYPLLDKPTTKRKTAIVGEYNTSLVNNKNVDSHLPLICGAEEEDIFNAEGINFVHDLTVKNCNIIPATATGELGLYFFTGDAENVKLMLENCLFERTLWVFMQSRNKNISWHIKDCYFVNMSGKWHRRSGGVFHVLAPQDSLLVENSTHVMASGYLYRFWDYQFNRIIFNHNTFINCANVVFQDFGYQSAVSTTNNIFVNCNIQPYCDFFTSYDDVFEFDPDTMAIGLVNIHDLPDSIEQLNRRYLFKNNVVYWDPRFGNIVDTLDANKVNGVNNWINQMVVMNERTQIMFDDNESYPYLTEENVYTEIPNFKESRDLLTSQVDILKAWVIAIVNYDIIGSPLPTWRLINIGSENYVSSDWPIPVDLSYDNADLLIGATNGFPVGDLNWFPDKKVQWNAQREAEYDSIEHQLGPAIVSIEKDVNLIEGFKLHQNYPNPFNPSTMISWQLAVSSHVELSIYNILGQKVVTLVDKKQSAGNHQIEWDASGLASGVYMYCLNVNGQEASMKMILLR
jgi:hypothetical protein